MSTTFDTIEVVDPAESLPSWSTTWLGTDGCNSRTVYYGSGISFTDPPRATKGWYNERSEKVYRSPRTYTGSRGRNAYPPYRFTPHYVSSVVTEEFLVRRNEGSAGQDVYYQYGSVPKIAGACTPTISRVEHTGPIFPQWRTVRKASDYAASSYTKNGFDGSEISDAQNEVENAVSADALSSYDVLTEIAELREIPHAVGSIATSMMNIYRSMDRAARRTVFKYNDFWIPGSKTFGLRNVFHVRPIELLRNPYKAIRELGNLWMAYRYSIMPLVYSYRDIVKTMKRGTNVTTRKMRSVSPKNLGVSLPGKSTIYKLVDYQGTISIRGNVFQNFTSESVARAGGLGTNLFVSAWELIPMSFVADWFINAGDYIARRCGSSYAAQMWSCLSRRDSYTKTTYVHLPQQDVTCAINNRLPTNWLGSSPPTPSPQVLPNPEGLYPVSRETVNSYSRWLFDVSKPTLRLDPSLNWRRYLDAAVMSHNIFRSFIRSFRKGL